MQRVSITPAGIVRVTVRLKRGGSVSGIVNYDNGTSAASVALTAKMRLVNGRFADTIGTGASHSDSSGYYSVDGLPNGAYIILGAVEGKMIPVIGGEQGGAGLIIFAKSTFRPSQAQIVVINDSSVHREANIIIALSGMHEVAGVITAASDEHRLNHGLVRLYPTGEPRFPRATPLGADGTFRFDRVASDSYTISLEDIADWKVAGVNTGRDGPHPQVDPPERRVPLRSILTRISNEIMQRGAAFCRVYKKEPPSDD